MSSTPKHSIPTTVLIATVTVLLAMIALTRPAGAQTVTRTYLDLPAEQLPEVLYFQVGKAGDGPTGTQIVVTVDVTIPATVPDGHVWTYYQSAFPAGGFDGQQPTVTELAPGQHFTVMTMTDGDPCAQIDLKLVGPLNPNGAVYAADLTSGVECQPTYTPPTYPVPGPPAAVTVAGLTSDTVAPATTIDTPAETTTTTTPEETTSTTEDTTPTSEEAIDTVQAETLPTTGGNTGVIGTLGFTLIALGFACKGLGRAKRAGLR